jgi:hypothetical protein
MLDILKKRVLKASNQFRDKLLELDKTPQGFSKEAYIRFLQMQFHLTKDVQRHFFICASHSDMSHRKALRQFLITFGNEEELHYKIAEKDLENMGADTNVEILDVKLWKAYFNSVIVERPFLRLGATCILENIAACSNDIIDKLFSRADYLTPRNSKFVTIHRHGPDLPHGDQILEALANADLEERHVNDLLEGTQIGRVMYMRMFAWVLSGDAEL